MLGIARSKCGVTVSPRSCAAAGAATAIAKAAPAARRADLIFMAVVLLPRLVDLPWSRTKYQELTKLVDHGSMPKLLHLELDRTAKTPLAEQIRNGVSNAIENGVLASGARLPSWQDLAAQLGVARGTVRSAYEKLSAGQLIVASRATGTHVAAWPSIAVRLDQPPDRGSFMEMYQELTARPGIFQMGVPARETFPATLFARIRSRAVRAESSAAPLYPDPRGEPDLRREIAAYLAIARGIECSPSQIVVTGGFGRGLGLALRVLELEGRKVWMEDPGFPLTRRGLELARLSLAPIPVDG